MTARSRGGPRAAVALTVALLAACALGIEEEIARPDCEGLPTVPQTEDGVPVALLVVGGGEVLPSSQGATMWLGGGEPIEIEEPDLPRLRFIVSQVRNSPILLFLSDDVRIADWEVWAVPASDFRRGDLETSRTLWADAGDPVAAAVDRLCINPQPGDWLVGAEITYAEGHGTGRYYWRLIVLP